MKISYNWLKSYLDIKLTPEKLSELLTDTGLEVEGLTRWESVQGGLEGIVIGKVESCVPHPNSDHLSLTKVDTGSGEYLSIVCGAPNVASGQKVVVATVNTTLYHGDESFVIKKSKIRGEVSEGMICAEDEIGLGSSHAGIMVLDDSAKVGTPAREYFNIEQDYIFEIGLTPNRTDGMSHIGVARDIKAALNKAEFEDSGKVQTEINFPSVADFKRANQALDIDVVIENPEACPRYTGVTLSGIKVEESPAWLQNRLKAIGLSPINNIVDITNFVMHETGQPLHAFDADKIKGNKVVVKKLPAGTVFKTLDETDRKLTENDLMICDDEKGMCIGGIFGGAHSGVSDQTSNIFLESAYFDPVHIRKSSRYHDLQTDASFRFERGVDPQGILFALKRAALLIEELAGGNISSVIKDVDMHNFKAVEVSLWWKHIDRLVGKAIPHELIKSILQSLDFTIKREDEEGLKVEVPAYRVDVTREADVIEEILRIYGFNNIPLSDKVMSTLSYRDKPDADYLQNRVSDYLSANGFYEIMNNSLTKEAYYADNPDFEAARSISILNPLSNDLNVLRQSLLYHGLENIIYNINRKTTDMKLYEFGKRYFFQQEENFASGRYQEQRHLALFMTGKKQAENWMDEQQEMDYYQLKAFVQAVLNMLGLEQRQIKVAETTRKYFHYGLDFSYHQKHLLNLGALSRKTLHPFDIQQAVFYAEIDWEYILKLQANHTVSFEALPKFPMVRRDLSLLLDRSVTYEELKNLAFKTEKKLLVDVNLFDIYEGKSLPAGKKSYALSFILQDHEKTLRDKVIDKVMKKFIMVFEKELGAAIR